MLNGLQTTRSRSTSFLVGFLVVAVSDVSSRNHQRQLPWCTSLLPVKYRISQQNFTCLVLRMPQYPFSRTHVDMFSFYSSNYAKRNGNRMRLSSVILHHNLRGGGGGERRSQLGLQLSLTDLTNSFSATSRRTYRKSACCHGNGSYKSAHLVPFAGNNFLYQPTQP